MDFILTRSTHEFVLSFARIREYMHDDDDDNDDYEYEKCKIH
jgi:hypothetical protein